MKHFCNLKLIFVLNHCPAWKFLILILRWHVFFQISLLIQLPKCVKFQMMDSLKIYFCWLLKKDLGLKIVQSRCTWLTPPFTVSPAVIARAPFAFSFHSTLLSSPFGTVNFLTYVCILKLFSSICSWWVPYTVIISPTIFTVNSFGLNSGRSTRVTY